MLRVLDSARLQKLHWLLGAMSSAVKLSPFVPADYKGRRYSDRALDYAAIHHICALLLEGLGPEAVPGEHEFGEFTLSMWDMFQQAVATTLRRGLAEHAFVDGDFEMLIGGGFKFEPDVVVRRSAQPGTVVVEVKYKNPADGISPQDIRQAVAYATALDASHAVLVYPTPDVPAHTLTAGAVTLSFAHLDLSEHPSIAAKSLVGHVEAKLQLVPLAV
jgi:5-methylcytosine-specific restriction endonuclease McrBC regulatory subunit McrC